MAVRGGAGVGKTYFVASTADAGLGRLCIIDMQSRANRPATARRQLLFTNLRVEAFVKRESDGRSAYKASRSSPAR